MISRVHNRRINRETLAGQAAFRSLSGIHSFCGWLVIRSGERVKPGITITGYAGPNGTVIIPGTIFGLPVVSVGNSAFSSMPSLTKVTIPDSVTSIGASAFSF